MRTAKSCGPDASTLASSCAVKSAWRWWQESPITRESTKQPVKPLRREGRSVSASPVCSCVHFLCINAHETAGAACTRSSLRPLACEGANEIVRLGQKPCRENADVYLAVIASEAKQSRATRKSWIASSQVLLAMTTWMSDALLPLSPCGRGKKQRRVGYFENSRARRRRQEMNVVFGGESHHVFGLLFLHVVQAPEQIIELLGRRHPEQHFRGLVGFVEDAVRNAHAQPNQIAGAGLRVGARQHEIEFSLQHVEIFVLVGMDVRRHEGAGRQGRVPGERILRAALRHIGLAQNIPGNTLHALIGAGDAGDLALHRCFLSSVLTGCRGLLGRAILGVTVAVIFEP